MAMSFLLANKSLITRDPTEKSLPELCCLNKLINKLQNLQHFQTLQKMNYTIYT